jgi:hypothetical protein
MNGSSSYEKWGCIGSIATAVATVLAAIIGGAFLIYANNQQNKTDSPPPVTVIIDAPAANSAATAPPTSIPPTEENTSAELNVLNNGAEDICYMYISLSSLDDWGSDQLDSQETIKPGASRVFNVSTGEYDFRAKNCEDVVIQESYNNMVQGTTDWSVDQIVTSPSTTIVRENVRNIEVNVDFDIFQSDQKGMLIKLTFSVSGYKDGPAKAIAYFETQAGEPLPDLNDSFSTTNGNVSAFTEFQPSYDNTDYTNLEIFMPYDELHLGEGEHELRFSVSLYDTVNEEFFGESEYFNFRITK